MDRLFRSSGLMRQKWDRTVGNGQTYGERTVQKAIEGTRKDPPKGRKAPEPPPPPPQREPQEAAPEAPPAVGGGSLPPIAPSRYTLDDTGNAYRFRDRYRDRIRYNFARDSWMVWDGRRWRVDETSAVKRMADDLLYDLLSEAQRAEDAALVKHIRRSMSSKNKEAMLKEARHLEGVPIYPAQLDRYRHVINLPNGVIHLKKGGELRPHNPEYYLSKMAGTPYDPDAACPRWLAFLEDVTLGDREMIRYLQVLCGYCLTGSTQEQCMYFLHGNGRNGKSTFMDVLARVLGDYAVNAQPETLMVRDKTGGTQARGDIARLEGARMVSTFEPNAGFRLDEGMVKQMTGGDLITARYMYKAEFEFRPEFKILMATNYKPEIRGTDDGIWRRVRLIPFEAAIPEDRVDPRLPEKLAEELPGILGWMLEGAKIWYQEGRFPTCQRIDGASQEYRREMDHLAQFLSAGVLPQEGGAVKAVDLYACYTAWAKEEGYRYPKSASRFGAEMKKKLKSHRGGKGVYYDGVALTDEGRRLQNTPQMRF